jgi:hypothetical protein
MNIQAIYSPTPAVFPFQKVTLPLPADIMQHVQDDDWISRSIYDKKVH